MARPSAISLSQAHLAEIALRGVPAPTYDRELLAPRIVHVGVGGFHRAHLALYVHELASGGADWGIVGLGLLDKDAEMAAALRAQDHLYTLIERGDGEPSARVIGSIVGFVHAPDGRDAAVAGLVASAATSILSLTVTEAGYGEPSAEDLAAGAGTTFDRIAAALAVRRERAAGPLTILSCDNLPGNGDAARRATLAAAARADPALPVWVQENCTFPNSMVDRITPQTAAADHEWLRDTFGVDDRWPVVAEPFRQWVMEDDFSGGRPPWEDVGALFTDRIHDWELYKLRLLNAGHSCVAYLSALAGITFVHEAMATRTARTFLEDLLLREAMPTLVEIPGHPREPYVASVLERFANPGVRDQIARVCIDGSAKFPTFLIPTIARQLEVDGPIGRAATALAGWARYLAVVDPDAQAFDSSADVARRHAAAALADPVAFLEFDAVFPPAVQASPRFRAAFSNAYRRIAEDGPIAAMGPSPERELADGLP
ncbi:MAG TPA: mannitol dehydrogenase family protein [Solirubrobacteraceae bacterium]|nr:mannitol dehydrogenase family protein [Solirubrobacteraceae bacterium]